MYAAILLAALLSTASSVPLPSHIPQECKDEIESKYAHHRRLSPGEAHDHEALMKKVIAGIDLSKCSNVAIKFEFEDGEEEIPLIKKEDEIEASRKTIRKKNSQVNTRFSQPNGDNFNKETNKNIRRDVKPKNRLRKIRSKNGPRPRVRRRRRRPQGISDTQNRPKPSYPIQNFRKRTGNIERPYNGFSNFQSGNRKLNRFQNVYNPKQKITNNYEDTYQDESEVDNDYVSQNNGDRFNYYQQNTRRPYNQNRRGFKNPNVSWPQNRYPNTRQPENNFYSYNNPNNRQDSTQYGTKGDYQDEEQENINEMETTSAPDKADVVDDEKSTTIPQNDKNSDETDDINNKTTLSDVEYISPSSTSLTHNEQTSSTTIKTIANNNNVNDTTNHDIMTTSYETTTETTTPATTTTVSPKSTTGAISDEKMHSPVDSDTLLNSGTDEKVSLDNTTKETLANPGFTTKKNMNPNGNNDDDFSTTTEATSENPEDITTENNILSNLNNNENDNTSIADSLVKGASNAVTTDKPSLEEEENVSTIPNITLQSESNSTQNDTNTVLTNQQIIDQGEVNSSKISNQDQNKDLEEGNNINDDTDLPDIVNKLVETIKAVILSILRLFGLINESGG